MKSEKLPSTATTQLLYYNRLYFIQITGIALGQKRADKQNGTATKAPEDDSDKEFNAYLEKYLADNPDAVLLKAQPNGHIENEVTK